ncbi:MAG: hypothetical protein ACE5KK_03985 [Candidatus Brocadiales bacterium]
MKDLIYNNKSSLSARLILTGLLFFVGLPANFTSAQYIGSSLPTEAQAPFLRGLAAVKQQQWELAVTYFSEAQRAAPESPEVLFYLGAASDKAGGRDLLAIAWFRAYLAAAPNAANAEQVRAKILELEVKTESAIQTLIRNASETVAQLGEETYKSYAYSNIAEAQATAGDTAGARRSLDKAKDAASRIQDSEVRDIAYNRIATAKARTGDMAGAWEMAERLRDEIWKTQVYSWIAQGLAGKGLISKAKETVAAKITRDRSKSTTYAYIAVDQAQTGDIVGAKETALSVTYDNDKVQAYSEIAVVQVQVGDVTGARESIALAKEAASRLSDGQDNDWYYWHLVTAQAGAGDIAGAKETASRIKGDSYKPDAYCNIAKAQAKAGDAAGARQYITMAKKVAERITEDGGEARVYKDIATAQASAGDIAGAMETAYWIKAGDVWRLRAYKEIALAQVKSGPEIRSWIDLALTYQEKSSLTDFHDFIDSLKDELPGMAVENLTEATKDTANALKELQDNDVKWQELRAKSAP